MAIEAEIISPPGAQFVEWRADSIHPLGDAPNHLPEHLNAGLQINPAKTKALLGDYQMHLLGVLLPNNEFPIRIALTQGNSHSNGGLIAGVGEGLTSLAEPKRLGQNGVIVEFVPVDGR